MTTLSNDDLQLIGLLERSTGAVAHDVIVGTASVVYLVKPGDAGKAIGKGGANIKKLAAQMGRPVEIYEDGETPEALLRNLLQPATLTQVTQSEADGKKTLQIRVDPEKKGLAIGKGGERINRARMLVKRRFPDVAEIKVL